jgi:O-6-methylguanine DNA methyltransferase
MTDIAAKTVVIAEACQLIEATEELPKLDDLAASIGMGPFYFHRQLKAITGLTPKALREVPVGETVSYADIARRIGEPKAVRTVVQACGANKIAVAVPCHRVVNNDGALSGYRWGVDRKRALLEKEAQA